MVTVDMTSLRKSDQVMQPRRKESGKRWHECLVPGLQRDEIYASHPVVRNTLQITTGPVIEAGEAIREAIFHRDPGTYFLAEPRTGKTTAIDIVKKVLPQALPMVPMLDFIAKSHCSRSEKNFFGDLLLELQHAGGLVGTAVDRRIRFLNFARSVCELKRSDLIVMFFDEGQNWGEFEYELLRDAINDLRKAGVTCITIIFGHPNLDKKVRQDLLRNGRTDLIGRFLVTPIRFRGIQAKSELREILDAYDNASRYEYPPGSGLSYSEFFMPQAFSEGWRLSEEIDFAWPAFESLGGRGGSASISLGMQWVTAAVRNLLYEIELQSRHDLESTSTCWEHAVRAASYEWVSDRH